MLEDIDEVLGLILLTQMSNIITTTSVVDMGKKNHTDICNGGVWKQEEYGRHIMKTENKVLSYEDVFVIGDTSKESKVNKMKIKIIQEKIQIVFLVN